MKKLENQKFTAGLALSSSKGFTLIELMVVIAIIGILSGIVMTSLGTAKNKSKNAAIQSGLGSLRAQAEIYFSDNGTYAGIFSSPPACGSTNSGVKMILDKLNADASSDTACWVSDGSAYAVSARLSNNTGGIATYWCVDSTGKSQIQANHISSEACQ